MLGVPIKFRLADSLGVETARMRVLQKNGADHSAPAGVDLEVSSYRNCTRTICDGGR